MLEQIENLLKDNNFNTIGIVSHVNPDPDAIGSILGMKKLINLINPEIVVVPIWDGVVSGTQNKTLVNVLNISMTLSSSIDDWSSFADGYISVDAMPERTVGEGGNCILVVDHHKADTKQKILKDIRISGSCCAIIWSYFEEYEKKYSKEVFSESDDLDIAVATAMVIGIKTDTNDFVSENVKDIDFEAHKHLTKYIDRRNFSSIINCPIPQYHFEVRSRLDKEDNYETFNGVFVGGLEFLSTSKDESLYLLADERSRCEGIDTSIVFAIVGECLKASVRSTNQATDVNSLCHDIFGKDFSGGKPGGIGGANVPVTTLIPIEKMSDELKCKLWSYLRDSIFEKVKNATKI